MLAKMAWTAAQLPKQINKHKLLCSRPQAAAAAAGSRDHSAAWLGWPRPPCAAASSASPTPAALPRPGPGALLRRVLTRWTRSTPTSTSGRSTPMSAIHPSSLRSYIRCSTNLTAHPSLYAEGPSPAHSAAREPAQLILLRKVLPIPPL